MFIKRLVILLAFIFSNTLLFSQTCPFVGKWKLMDIMEERNSILEKSCNNTLILNVEGNRFGGSIHYMQIRGFMGSFYMLGDKFKFDNYGDDRSIINLLSCNTQIVISKIGSTNGWKMANDTLVLYNETLSMVFLRKIE
jgi:hypothetical protein